MTTKFVNKAVQADVLTAGIIGSLDAEFHSASDRSFAVLAASYMDAILEQLLRAAFVEDFEATEKLLGLASPIGSNGARYNLAYSLALISKNERDDLKIIADLRNRFAHQYSVVTFETDDKARDLVRGMHFTRRRDELRKDLAARTADPIIAAQIASSKTTPRVLFRDAVIEFLVLLLPRVRDVRRATEILWYPSPDAVDA